MHTKKQRIISFAVCAVYILAAFFSALFIVEATNHFCTGENCPVCAAVEAAENTIQNLSNGIADANNDFNAADMFFCCILICCAVVFSHSTLTMQKVRLNN